MPGKELGLVDLGAESGENRSRLIDTACRQNDADLEHQKVIPSLSVLNKKVVSLNQEYAAMLTSTLESQRLFYQESLASLEGNAEEILDRKSKEIHTLERSLQELDHKVEG